MNVQISRHVFGADRGYRTLAASSDVTPEEQRELEAFTFGQTHDTGYLDSLGRVPAYWSRPLASGRRAITRVLKGDRDDQGRPTLLFITGVVGAREWLAGLCGDEPAVFANEEFCTWQPGTDLARVTIRIEKRPVRPTTPQQREKILSVLGALEGHNDDPMATVVVAEEELNPDDIRLLTLLLPGESTATFSYAMRSLSDGLPVRLNCLADCASQGKSRRRIVRWRPGMTYENWRYTSALAYFWTPGESPPWEFVANCKSFGQIHLGVNAGKAKRVSNVPPPIARVRNKPRRPFPAYAILIVGLVILVGITASFVGRKLIAKQRAESLLAEATAFLDEHPVKTSLTHDLCQEGRLQEDASRLASEISEVQKRIDDKRLETKRGQLARWTDDAKRRCADYKTIEDLLAEFRALSGPLGLDAPDTLEKYPSAAEMKHVESWEGKAQEHLHLANALGERYAEQIRQGLNRIAALQERLPVLRGQYDEKLASLEEFYRGKVPEPLSDEVVETWDAKRTELENLGRRMGIAGEEQIDEDMLPLQKRYAECKKKADKRQSEIDSLQANFQEALKEAHWYMDEGHLRGAPVFAGNLAEPWQSAVRAQEALKRALNIWADHEEAEADLNEVGVWMEKASNIAFSRFQDDFNEAKEKWEQTLVAYAQSNGIDNTEEAPKPQVVLRMVNRALDYWEQNEQIIESRHKKEGGKLHTLAIALQIELEDAIK